MTTTLPARRAEAAETELRAAEVEATTLLRGFLLERAWPQLYLHLGHGRLFAPDPARAARELDALPAAEARLLQLFGLGLPVVSSGLDPAERTLLRTLGHAGLALEVAGAVRTTGYVVVPVLGGLVMCGVPSTYAPGTHLGSPAYLGEDSIVLASLLGPLAGRRVLDLGAGCGVQGVLAARGASEAVLTDIDPSSLKLSALNAVLNDVDHPLRFARGDLFEPVRGERFDVIVVLPPYVPVAQNEGVSATAAGGPDGLAFIRRLLLGAEEVLGENGELVMFAQLLCDDREPLLCRELGGLAPRLDTRLTLVDRHPLQPYVLELARRLAGTGRDLRQSLVRLDALLRADGATGVCTAAIRARRPGAAIGPRRRDLSASPSLHSGSRLRLATSTQLSRRDQVLLLTSEAAPPHFLDDVTAALVAAIAPGARVAQAARDAWGSPPGSRPEQLVEQALARLAPLLAAGLLEEDETQGR